MNMNNELYEKMSRIQWLLHRQHMKAHAIAGPMAGASRGQGRILAFLKMKDGISTKDLSYLLGIRVSSLNELLSKLEKADYITREPSQSDKRIMLIYLTEKGRQEEEEAADENDLFACLSQEEQATFGEYLDRIITALEATLGTDDEREEMSDWMKAARERMGPEQFEQLMAMRSMRGMHGGFHRHKRNGRGRDFHGFRTESRCPMHDNMPERVRLDCEYNCR